MKFKVNKMIKISLLLSIAVIVNFSNASSLATVNKPVDEIFVSALVFPSKDQITVWDGSLIPVTLALSCNVFPCFTLYLSAVIVTESTFGIFTSVFQQPYGSKLQLLISFTTRSVLNLEFVLPNTIFCVPVPFNSTVCVPVALKL